MTEGIGDQGEPVDTSTALEAAAWLIVDRPPRLGRTRLVTVDGPSGSGKTVFAAALAERLRAAGHDTALVAVDLLTTWEDPFGWWPRLDSGLLQEIAAGRPGTIRANDWSSGEPLAGPLVTVPVPQVLILEGVSSGRAAVADRTSVAIWVEVRDRAERLERAVRRDGEHQRRHFVAWQTAEDRHFPIEHTRDRADLLVDPTAG